MRFFFFSFSSSHSSRVVCEGILRNVHLGTCCDKKGFISRMMFAETLRCFENRSRRRRSNVGGARIIMRNAAKMILDIIHESERQDFAAIWTKKKKKLLLGAGKLE